MKTFEAPTVTDYGSLADLTEATGNFGAEDGASKNEVHHTSPTGS